MDCRGLGYLVIETPDRDEVGEVSGGVVGLMPDSGPEGAEPNSSHFRMDDRIYRISVTTASQETYVAGWELPNEGAWRAAISALETAGVAVLTCDSSEAKLRGVSGLANSSIHLTMPSRSSGVSLSPRPRRITTGCDGFLRRTAWRRAPSVCSCRRAIRPSSSTETFSDSRY